MWLPKDRYKTDSGAIMTIVSTANFGIECRDSADGEGDSLHTFDFAGHSLCGGCVHGHLKERLTGKIQDMGR